jgi:primary-amine oxidase
MPCRSCASVLLFFVSALVAPLAAQDEPQADRATGAMLVQAIDRLGATFERQGGAYVFNLDDKRVEMLLLGKGDRLLVKTRYGQANPPLEILNRYNEQVAITTRAVRYADLGVILEAGLDCTLGVSDETIRRFVLGFVRDTKTFDAFLAKNPAPKGPTEQPAASAKPQSFPLRIAPGNDDKQLEISFPTDEPGPGETAWKIIWDMSSGAQLNREGFRFGKGRDNALLIFRIKQAFFRPGRNAPWLQVLDDVHPSEFYVPYYFQNTRFFDLRDVGGYTNLSAKEGGPRSKLLGFDRRVMAEIRDRGIAYKHGGRTRRGEEFVLWANFVAGNYTYLVEFCFHDDGTVALKHAPTGYNFFAHFDEAAHMHNVLWRIGVRLSPAFTDNIPRQQVHVVSLPYEKKQIGPQGKLKLTEIEQETPVDWDPKEFTRLRVTNPGFTLFPKDGKKPARPISYELVPSVTGQARHYRYKDEGFSEHDFWVTRADCPEKMYVYLHDYFRGKDYNGQKSAPQPLTGADGVVLWHMSSALHIPRGEDGILFGNNSKNGQALVSWTSVELRPRNLFTKTPIYREK